MEVRNQIKSSATPKRVAIAAAIAVLCAGFTAPALADGTEDVLNVLHAKGILSDSEYESLLKKLRAENKEEALVQAKAAEDTAAALKKAQSASSDTKVGGTIFADFSNVDLKNNGARVAPSGTGFDIKRAYLTVDHTFNDTWSANLTTDVNYIAADAETQVYVKKAYLQGKFFDGALWARAGSADMPWIPFDESLYGYRWIENTLIDRLKFGNSADWGIHAGGSVANNMFGYALSAVDGAGYKNPQRPNSPDYEGRINFMPIDGLTLGAGFYNGEKGSQAAVAPAIQQTAERWDAVIGYVNPQFRLGAEYFHSDNYLSGGTGVAGTNNYTLQTNLTQNISDSSDGYSLWASFNFLDQYSVFARYDSVNLSKDINPSFTDEYYNLGLSYAATKGVDIALVYKHENVDGGALPTASSNNTIGEAGGNTIGATAGARTGRSDEIGLYSQVKF